MRPDRREAVEVAALLVLALVFGFVILPIGIGLGYGNTGTGLSPRFMPQLATAGIAIALAVGLVRTLVGATPTDPAATRLSGQRHPFRVLGAFVICMLFASVGFRLLGFYVGGAVMVMVLTLLLGVRKAGGVLLFPIMILAAIYLIFELGLQVRLPKSDWFSGLPL